MRGVAVRGLGLVLAAAVVASCAVGIAVRTETSTAEALAPNTLRATFGSFPDYLDPQLSYTFEGWTAMYDVYVPLLAFRHANGPTGTDVVPGLAADLPKVTNGGRTYTLRLRPGLRYSDGSPVRASDFEHAVKRLFKMGSGAGPFFAEIAGSRRYRLTHRGGIGGIDADNRTGRIVIHLLRPDGSFEQLLATPFAAPVPASTPLRDQTFHPPAATGPYVITSSQPGVGWTYARNPAWTSTNGALMPQIPAGHVDAIEVQVIHDIRRQVEEVLSGRLDWMQNPPPASMYRQLRDRYEGTQLRSEPTLSTYYFWMNTTRPPFDDLRVRRAANFAINARALRRIYDGTLEPSRQILPAGMPGYQRFELYRFDLAKARRLIAAADPADRDVTVWTSSERPNDEAAAYYARQLRRIGLRAHLEVVNADYYFSVIGSRRTPDLDTGWSDWYADFAHPDDWFRPLLLGSGILPSYNGNFARLRVPSLDAAIERLKRQRLGPAQERAYAALDRHYMRLAPWVPYGNRTLAILVSRAVDLDGVVWNRMVGPDMASLRLR